MFSPLLYTNVPVYRVYFIVLSSDSKATTSYVLEIDIVHSYEPSRAIVECLADCDHHFCRMDITF